MEVGDSTSGFACPTRELGRIFQLQEFSAPYSTWEVLSQGTEEETVSRSFNSGGTIQFLSWSWNTGPALYPLIDTGGCAGVLDFVDLWGHE